MSIYEEGVITEISMRRDLAAAYRIAAMFGWDDSIYTHFSARLPGEGEPRFLINPFGMLFEEICASDLIVVDMNGKVIDGNADYNLAGFTIHSATHLGREDAHCVIHTHTVPGMAVAACDQGLLQLNQISAEFFDRLGYHDYEGVAFNLDERSRLQKSLGQNIAMVLRNHGLLSVGKSVADAFVIMYYLNKACEIQLATSQIVQLGSASIIPDKLALHVSHQFRKVEHERQLVWQAFVRKLDKVDESYKN